MDVYDDDDIISISSSIGWIFVFFWHLEYYWKEIFFIRFFRQGLVVVVVVVRVCICRNYCQQKKVCACVCVMIDELKSHFEFDRLLLIVVICDNGVKSRHVRYTLNDFMIMVLYVEIKWQWKSMCVCVCVWWIFFCVASRNFHCFQSAIRI